jgi:archaellum component FlaF (FlaF/FlaG flagellin family)
VKPRQIRIALAWAVLAVSASAQVSQPIPFGLLFTEGQTSETIANGAALSFSAPAGQSQTAQIVATYSGAGQVTISQQPTLFGSTVFTASVQGALPLTLKTGASATIALAYSPTSATPSSVQFSLPFTETVQSVVNAGSITLSLAGSTPAFVLSYALQTNQNAVPLQPGGNIAFPPTLAGSTAQATLSLTNTGSGPGTVNSITISGSAFLLQGKPLLPATVPTGQTITALVLYQPTGVTTDTGQITITFAASAPVTINLTGSGSAPSLTYQLLNSNPPTVVSPGGTITLPGANLGQTTSVTVQVLNSGSASGSVSSISVVGQGFQLINGPALPLTLLPGASTTFTVTFTPTQAAFYSGTLLLNSATFSLSGIGLGPLLTFSYVAGGSTITLSGTNPSVVFSPVAITQSEQLTLAVKNAGTLPATISNIGVQQTGGPFVVSGLPALPVTLAPNAGFQIAITFTPTALGFSNTNLLFDTTAIALVGSGTQPPPLPAYTIAGPSGNTAPMAQPAIGLTLASPYPVAISGTLTMSVTGTLPADPAVQFATGGSTVSFTIPANQTSAVFGAQGTQLGLQTGTVASTVTITPAFATQAGDVNLTPAVPTVLQFAVAPAAPALIAIEFTGQSATGFTIQVTGFTTTRSLTSLAVQFGIAPGFSMPVSQFTINVNPIATLWFESTASRSFGSLFTIAIPFTFQGVAPAGESVLSAIASVSVSASNAVGSSNSVQAVP